MPSANDLANIQEKRGTYLFVGYSGDGKTCAGYSFPGPILHFDLDRRWKGVMGHPLLANDRPRLSKVEVRQYDLSTLSRLENDLNVLQIEKPANFKYQTVIFDGVSTFSDLVIAQALRLNGGGKQVAGKGLPGWDEFGFEQRCFQDIILALKMLPCNVIITAHWVDDYDDNGKKVGKKVNLRDKVWAATCKYIDEIYYFEKREAGQEGTRHLAYFRSRLARTTFLGLPNSIDWTGQNFYDLWINEIQKTEPKG